MKTKNFTKAVLSWLNQSSTKRGVISLVGVLLAYLGILPVTDAVLFVLAGVGGYNILRKDSKTTAVLELLENIGVELPKGKKSDIKKLLQEALEKTKKAKKILILFLLPSFMFIYSGCSLIKQNINEPSTINFENDLVYALGVLIAPQLSEEDKLKLEEAVEKIKSFSEKSEEVVSMINIGKEFIYTFDVINDDLKKLLDKILDIYDSIPLNRIQELSEILLEGIEEGSN